MAFKAPYEIRCSCGKQFTNDLYEYVFTAYDPELKEALLSGEFNLVTCPSCQESLHVENRFLYRDEKSKLWVWVCIKEEEPQKDQLFEDLFAKNTYFADHFLDEKEDYRKFLVFGREGLIELLLKEDKNLKRTEGKHLKNNPALRLVMEEHEKPGHLFLSGKRIKISLPLKLPNTHKDLVTGSKEKEKWLKFYSRGLNTHNPYSSFLTHHQKLKWGKIRDEEPLENTEDEFDDFAESWAFYKIDIKNFKRQFPERYEFFRKLREIDISRKLLKVGTQEIFG